MDVHFGGGVEARLARTPTGARRRPRTSSTSEHLGTPETPCSSARRASRLIAVEAPAALRRPGAPDCAQRGPCCRDDLVDVRQLASELPNMADRLAVLDQERRAPGDVGHPQELRRDAECASRLPVPVGEERHVLRAQRPRPGLVGPRRVAGDRERTDPDSSQVLAPVTQEQNLVGSGRRPVPEVEGEERQPGAEHVPERPRLLACRSPDLDVRDGVAWSDRHPSTDRARLSGVSAKRACAACLDTPRAWAISAQVCPLPRQSATAWYIRPSSCLTRVDRARSTSRGSVACWSVNNVSRPSLVSWSSYQLTVDVG